MTSRNGHRRRVLSPEERVLWSAVTKSIAPLRETAGAEAENEMQTAEALRPAPSARKSIPSRSQSTDAKPLPPLAPLGRRMKQRVARGKETIDGRLDLHGLTQSEAHATLLHFLRSASSRGARLVLVITGKGVRGGDGERGVLKRQVPQWLGLPEFRTFVLGFEDAHIAHGGGGVLYVRVRRPRG
jgi:DNA-nicking Smr family endonuclease